MFPCTGSMNVFNERKTLAWKHSLHIQYMYPCYVHVCSSHVHMGSSGGSKHKTQDNTPTLAISKARALHLERNYTLNTKKNLHCYPNTRTIYLRNDGIVTGAVISNILVSNSGYALIDVSTILSVKS